MEGKKRMNLLKHLFLREIYSYTAIKGKIHYIELNRNIEKIPRELWDY